MTPVWYLASERQEIFWLITFLGQEGPVLKLELTYTVDSHDSLGHLSKLW